MKITRKERKRARIEMIPLIDVTFLLLVFFIYMAMTMTIHRSISLSLPGASTSTIDPASHMTLSIDQRGRIYLDREEILTDALALRLRALRRVHPNVRLYLSGDRRAFYEKIIFVLDTARRTGIKKVFLETEGEKSK